MNFGDDKIEADEVIVVVAGTLAVLAMIFAIYLGRKNDNAQCQWEKEHGVVSYECRDWDGKP